MQQGRTAEHAATLLRRHTGIVIPVYLPEKIDSDLATQLLRDNVHNCVAQLDEPQRLVLSVDGADNGLEAAQAIAAEFGVQVCCAEQNGGKLHALRLGMARLWPDPELSYLAALDADGDHFANELLNFVRTAEYACAHRGVDEVLVLGRRISRHRPMGFLRGELEELADRVLLDALHYHAAQQGRPLRLECATTLEEFPDFHSGFKLFSRRTAAAVFLAAANRLGVTATAYYRHGVEAVISVEALESGALLALVNRSTFNEQPISTFGLLDRARLVADKMVWPCKRLGVPGAFVDQFLRNHMPRLQLTTLAPQGRDELLQIRRLVLAQFDTPAREDDLLWGPLFV